MRRNITRSAFGGFLDGIEKGEAKEKAAKKTRRDAAEIKRLRRQVKILIECIEVLKRRNKKLQNDLQWEKDSIQAALV
jgi:hypothetical protein